MDVSRTVARAMLRFHARHARLRLDAGEAPGPVVDDYLRGVEPYVGIASDEGGIGSCEPSRPAASGPTRYLHAPPRFRARSFTSKPCVYYP